MTKQKSTKRALVMSMLSLLLCVAMLIGSTFAWFTDSVTSAGNKIQSGTLKLDLELLDKETGWASIKNSKTPIFDYSLWEPGFTDVKILKIENEGNLALKWYAKFICTEALTDLAKVIDVYVLPSKTELTYPADRNLSGYTRVGTVAEFIEGIETSTYGNLKADEVAYLGIALKMQETAGNEYQNMDLGAAFDIQILATQDTVENDFFNNQYDKDAKYPGEVGTAAELAAALANNEDVKLLNDIVLTGDWTPIGDKDEGIYYTGTLDGNGHTISGLSVTNGDYVALISAAKDATIKNLTVEGSVAGENAAGVVARVEGNTVIENVTSNVTVKGTTKAGGIACNVTNSGKTVFINCVNNGAVSGGNSGIGGIIGYVNNDAYAEIIACENNANVISDNNKYAGAAVGYAAGTSKGSVVGMKNTGTVTGTLLSDGRFLKYGDTVLCGYVGTIGNWTSALLANPENVQTVINDALEGATVQLSAGKYGTIVAKSNITIQGVTGAVVDCVNLNKASNINLVKIDFDAAGAQRGYDGKGTAKYYANIITGDSSKPAKGARNLVIDGCSFTGTYANGGASIAFTDQSRGSGQSGDITIQNCIFDSEGAYYDIYGHYFGYGKLVIEGNTFSSQLVGGPIYLGRYQSSVPVVVKGNNFKTVTSFADAAYIQDHSNYGVSFDESNNTFAE